MKKIIIFLITLMLVSNAFSQKKNRVGYQLEYSCYNENVLVIHTQKKLSDNVEASYFSKTEYPLVKSMLSIDGIIEVRVDRYEVHLTKANLFQWKSIFPKVKSILSNEFNSSLLEIKTPIYGSCVGLSKNSKSGVVWRGVVQGNFSIYFNNFGSPLLTATATY